MGVVDPPELRPMTDEVDDYRPRSRWAFAVDPAERVDFGVIYELIAPGDRIPLHRHAVDELVLIVDGEAEITLGDEKRRVSGGATAFVPAGVVHGTRNVGETDVRFVAVFATTVVDMDLVERIPKPGTEDREAVPTEWNMRTGDVRVLEG